MFLHLRKTFSSKHDFRHMRRKKRERTVYIDQPKLLVGRVLPSNQLLVLPSLLLWLLLKQVSIEWTRNYLF
mgnify:CR=1 FL=1